ncbi:hypothetical protein C8R46DRAFT_1356044 [Mycena filopes]|nr:hypothetical protein C8R46DRAFT_1356044 [Mycena filopes]
MTPVLPIDIERTVFETLADLHPECIPALLCVACRVRDWIERIHYRSFTLAHQRVGARRLRLLQHAVEHKPAQFLGETVKYLGADHRFAPTITPDILAQCSGLQQLALMKSQPSILPAIQALPLRRLAIAPASIFGAPHTLPMFASLTHLDILGTLPDDAPCPTLALLPALTHLAVLHLHAPPLVAALLTACPRLTLLVGMYASAQLMFQAVCTHPACVYPDDRFLALLLTDEDYMVEWRLGVEAGKGPDMWARADALLARRRKGEVPPGCYAL